MLSELDNLRHELRTEKVQIRQKAFTKLYEILNSRLPELQRALENNDDITWESLFRAAHKGVIAHSLKLSNANTELQENDTKITSFSRVLLGLCDSCVNGEIHFDISINLLHYLLPTAKKGIPYQLLMACANEVLRNESLLLYFGKCYVQILQKYVLKPGNNLTPIPLDLWKGEKLLSN